LRWRRTTRCSHPRGRVRFPDDGARRRRYVVATRLCRMSGATRVFRPPCAEASAQLVARPRDWESSNQSADMTRSWGQATACALSARQLASRRRFLQSRDPRARTSRVRLSPHTWRFNLLLGRARRDGAPRR
jgi:hypothetical protein